MATDLTLYLDDQPGEHDPRAEPHAQIVEPLQLTASLRGIIACSDQRSGLTWKCESERARSATRSRLERMQRNRATS